MFESSHLLLNFQLISLPEKEDAIETMIKELTGEETKHIVNYLGIDNKLVKSVERLLKGDKIQTRMPFVLEIN